MMMEGARVQGYRLLREITTGVAIGAMIVSFLWRTGHAAGVLVVAGTLLPVLPVVAGIGVGRHSFAQTEEAYRSRMWLARVYARVAGIGLVVALVWNVLGEAVWWWHALYFGTAVAIAVVLVVWLRAAYPKAGADYL